MKKIVTASSIVLILLSRLSFAGVAMDLVTTDAKGEETGPIFVHGIEPGDVLAIHIEDINPEGHASGGWWRRPLKGRGVQLRRPNDGEVLEILAVDVGLTEHGCHLILPKAARRFGPAAQGRACRWRARAWRSR